MKGPKVVKCILGGHWHSLYYDHLVPQYLKDHCFPWGSYNMAHDIIKPWEYVGDLYRQLKWFYQRGKRGYAENSVWSIDWYLCSWMGNALRELAENVHGVPGMDVGRHDPLSQNPNDWEFLTLDEWRATILYIAETFDLGHKIQDYDVPGEGMEAAMKRFQHGMRMFTEYFFNLWD
jgi:hypothetical protein